MSERLADIATTTILDHKMFGLEDVIGEGSGDFGNGWVNAGHHSLWVRTPYDNSDAVLRLEEWDGEPGSAPDDDLGPWDDVVAVSMEYVGQNETIAINQVTAGPQDSGFALSRPGRYHVRAACRNGREAQQAYLDVLARFDEADWNSEACRQMMDEIDIKEEFLIQFWPAESE
ncbi:hypothetical protein ODJ79_35200 [Actinoplanes sp. KI2]|uniref:hypothetical protein n=1 Tax=Actinoplanes sp. KI2 TaxID=2983315 RepID=UPI0021D59C77|nr:hypothetical protein [Actinoplanes sp. KI2]MCU7728989.1 hypothetical protein [Actinoplanes sp. KI2]